MSGKKNAAGTHVIYRTTAKGRLFIEKLREIKKLLDAEEENIWVPRQLQVAT
jgi:predicted transcriptional regulator